MKKYSLTSTIRTVTGRKVKNLRKQGLLPATVYGKTIKSLSLSVPGDTFLKLYKEAGETGLIELTIESEKAKKEHHDMRPVLVHTVQFDPVSGVACHVEFHQVDLKEKVHTNVPLELSGEAPAVSQKIGVLLVVLNELEIEALPVDLPEHVLVDVSRLSEVNQEIHVSDLSIPSGVTVLTDASLTVAKIGSLVTKEAEAQAAQEAAAAAAAQAPAEGAEAATQEATGEKEAKPQEVTSQEKPKEEKK